MKKVYRALLWASVAVMAVSGIALSHTGGIYPEQNCVYGSRVRAHLDANVAASSTWIVKINGSTVASGTGPGPRDLGPYNAGFSAGNASLTIVFNQEVNTYVTSWRAEAPCATPTPTPTATPRATPHATATPAPTSTPGRRTLLTLPPTTTPSEPVPGHIDWGQAIVFGLLGLAFVGGWLWMTKKLSRV